MDRLHKKVLKNCTESLFQNIEPKDFIDYIIQDSVLSEEEREIVMAQISRNRRVEHFLAYLKKKRSGFENLLRLCDHRGMGWLKETLLNEKDRLVAVGEDRSLVSKMNPEKTRVRLNEKQCLEIGRYISNDWKVVAVDLGFQSPEIYQIEAENRDDPRMAAFTLLNKWGQRKVNQANVTNLLIVLDENGMDYDENKFVEMFS